jgi:hypothetical protein
MIVAFLMACLAEPTDRDGDGVLDRADCAPDDPAIHPGAAEVCNALDDDCDGTFDEDVALRFRDADGDGFGDNPACVGVAEGGDCDDDDETVFPGAADGCNGVDDNCDGVADEAWDDDADGVSECGGDCDDTDPSNRPGNPEWCDGADNNCDGGIDEGFDGDGDGWASCRGDCDDADPARNPGNREACNGGVDDDCDPTTTEAGDFDNDGQTWCDGDCNDFDATIAKGRAEDCDARDNDCNGYPDDNWVCYGCYDIGGIVACQAAANFDTARHICSVGGLDLAFLTPDDSAYTIGETVYYNVVWWSEVWIGASDRDAEGDWRWLDGTEARSDLWNPGQPDNSSGIENCATFNYGGFGLWNDAPCEWAYPFLCR